jgi:hypothetical protein
MANEAELPVNPKEKSIGPPLNNTSCLDVFASGPDEEMSRREHREFWEEVAPVAMSATLEPGDLLFFPPGWWHAMRSEETSFSVSMWF